MSSEGRVSNLTFRYEIMDFNQFINECDSLIKGGQIKSVTDKFRALSFGEVPRKWRQALAKICRRTGMIERGVRLLQPIVRREVHSPEAPASAGEICEYAVLLSRQGSVNEALELLKDIDKTSNPEAYLYLGFCHVTNWNYQQAAQDFESYLSCAVDPYSLLIGKVNLVAACISNRQLNRARILLSEILETARNTNALRLIGNCLELSGQVEFCAGNFTEARRYLDQALEVFGQSGSYDQLLIQKWRATITALENKSTAELLKFREEAVARKHWESVRDTDFYILKLSFDQKLFDHLIYGTPSEFFRARVIREIGQVPSSTFIYNHETVAKDAVDFDLQSGLLRCSDDSVGGTKIHQAMSVFLRELYAPRSLGSLFSELYPNEYFDINSSATRVRQVIRRTRRWLEDQKIPASIIEKNGSYKLQWLANFSVRMELDQKSITVQSGIYHKVVQAFHTDMRFTAGEACSKIKISRTGFHRWATWAEENQLLEKSGNNKSTVYRILPELKKRAA